ncbi:glycoside hydrolase family 13 protein [Bounagaea algeriensis]
MSTWWRNAVIYQIYPRSFADTDGDGIGNISGITSRMDHLARLGVDAVWLSPCFPSPWIDGGYDVADYRDIDPVLGSLEDFDEMVAAAHARGLRVLLDIVPNHTSSEHPWFRQALDSEPGSPARERYVFREGRGPGGAQPPTNWLSRFGGPAWTRLPDGQWYLHLFDPQQPDLNWQHPQVRAEFRDILRFWGARGVDGFRIDVAHGLVKDLAEPLRNTDNDHADSKMAEFEVNPDHPFLDRPGVHEVYREWNAVFHEFDPPLFAVAEAWVPNASRVLYTRPGELQQAFNFEFLQVRWDAARYREVIDSSLEAAAEAGTVPTWVLSNHDVVRHPSVFGLPEGTDLRAWLLSDGTAPPADLELGTRRARAALLLELALPGSAYVYQGEELGLPEVADLPADALQDPRWAGSGGTDKGRDGCRVPLPWTRSGVSAGFSSAAGWLPQPEWWAEYSAEAQEGVPEGMLEFYRAALRLRREFADDERFAWDDKHNTGEVLAFRRGDDVLVLVNTGSTEVSLPAGEVLLSSSGLPMRVDEGEPLPADAAVWLRTG